MTSNAQGARDDDLDAFIADVGTVVSAGGSEEDVTEQVAARLRRLLAVGLQLPGSITAPRAERYVMRPLHVDPGGAFSIACAVWDVGQSTPVHGHETWGVVGIHSGVEREVGYVKPVREDEPLAVRTEADWGPGEVTVCCTTEDDVHQVACGSDIPCVGIHVYGADIGTLPRRSYEPTTGHQSWFVSHWG
ncbi:cysteine dioxygenase family protein [Amycolatopsis alkalitolerans]|uniref:Cysteine dioxygenase n=1 Tax=Amycolatopsis alkalitolerans TaxID=2547244 RepID=A0A5C4M435_9PSEU|nr:hypothetical protein [Amycolatopsis alkalitolerans]TNC27823.1 hypothetical protein FG385_08980 [Amycolatopsis alkalitolerans]